MTGHTGLYTHSIEYRSDSIGVLCTKNVHMGQIMCSLQYENSSILIHDHLDEVIFHRTDDDDITTDVWSQGGFLLHYGNVEELYCM